MNIIHWVTYLLPYIKAKNNLTFFVFSKQIPNEFVLTVKKDKKLDSIKLSSEYRNDILSSILKYYKEFADKPKNSEVTEILHKRITINLILNSSLNHQQRFVAYKYHWSGISLPTVLEVTPCSLDQLDPTTNEILASYMYKDIEGIIGIHLCHVYYEMLLILSILDIIVMAFYCNICFVFVCISILNFMISAILSRYFWLWKWHCYGVWRLQSIAFIQSTQSSWDCAKYCTAFSTIFGYWNEDTEKSNNTRSIRASTFW